MEQLQPLRELVQSVNHESQPQAYPPTMADWLSSQVNGSAEGLLTVVELVFGEKDDLYKGPQARAAVSRLAHALNTTKFDLYLRLGYNLFKSQSTCDIIKKSVLANKSTSLADVAAKLHAARIRRLALSGQQDSKEADLLYRRSDAIRSEERRVGKECPV